MPVAGQGEKNQVKTISRKKFITSHLRRGKMPAQVIELVMEEYGLGYDQSYQLVYGVNKEINDSLKELYDKAAEYLVRNLQSLAAEALEDNDRKSALKAYEQLAKICKVGADDGKQDITINFGFEFSDESKQ